MQKFAIIVLAFALLVGILVPGRESTPSASAAAAGEPGLFEAAPYKETKLQREFDGGFYVTAYVNGAPIRFVVDTGASSVALTEEDARSAGIEFSSGEFEPVARTANGIARGMEVTLGKVSIEGKDVADVDGMIVEGAEVSLLGQSYLSRISGVDMAGDHMILR